MSELNAMQLAFLQAQQKSQDVEVKDNNPKFIETDISEVVPNTVKTLSMVVPKKEVKLPTSVAVFGSGNYQSLNGFELEIVKVTPKYIVTKQAFALGVESKPSTIERRDGIIYWDKVTLRRRWKFREDQFNAVWLSKEILKYIGGQDE
jgi:hypothetical protein